MTIKDVLVQPFRLDDLVVVEKRTADGKLDFSEPQPPKMIMRFEEVYKLLFRSMKELQSAGWSDLEQWLNERGWKLRAKTW